MKLLTISNPKTQKSIPQGYLTAVLHLAPFDLSGYQTCPMAEHAGCVAGCLNKAGRGGIIKKGESTNVIQLARINRTVRFFEEREQFMIDLHRDIEKAIKLANSMGTRLAIRLNGTSDIGWEKIRHLGHRNIMEAFPGIQFYDYTKIEGSSTPDNYHLTLSRGKHTQTVKHQFNMAVVFRDHLPAYWQGRPVIDGDNSDLRFLDPDGVIVGLKAKGPAKKDYSGFVVEA